MNEVNPAPARYRRPRRGEVRERILEAAAKVFADKGFAGARTDDIAAAAGFSKGAVYSNFATKDKLFFALMDDQIARRAELVGRVLNQFPPTPDATAAISEQMTEVIAANRDWQLLFLDYWQRALRDEAVRDSFVAHRRAIRQALTEAIEHRVAEAGAQLALSPAQLMFTLLALSNGLAIEELADPGCVPRDLLGDILALGLKPGSRDAPESDH